MTPPKANLYRFVPHHGIGTLVTHVAEGTDPSLAHITPIYQSAAFRFPDVATGAGIISGEKPGYYYTRLDNPNYEQFADKLAVLEGLDLLRAQPGRPVREVVAAGLCASGMAAISTTVMAKVRAGDTLLVQKDLYGNAYNFFDGLAPRLGLNVVWVSDLLADLEQALQMAS